MRIANTCSHAHVDPGSYCEICHSTRAEGVSEESQARRDRFQAFMAAYDGYPSQDNEGYIPDRGGFKCGFLSAWDQRQSVIDAQAEEIKIMDANLIRKGEEIGELTEKLEAAQKRAKELERERDEATRKGVDLCQQNGELFMKLHDSHTRLTRIEKAAEGILWIDECRCDEAYTKRGMHKANALCGELDPLREALTAQSVGGVLGDEKEKG